MLAGNQLMGTALVVVVLEVVIENVQILFALLCECLSPLAALSSARSINYDVILTIFHTDGTVCSTLRLC